MYAGILSLLFVAVNAYNAFAWYSLRRSLVVNDDIPATMVEEFDSLNSKFSTNAVVDITLLASIILADVILVRFIHSDFHCVIYVPSRCGGVL